MPRTIPLRPGQEVVVQHGREALSGVVVAAVDHPAFGPCVDVEVGGRVRRFVADRVSPTAGPSTNRKRSPRAREVSR